MTSLALALVVAFLFHGLPLLLMSILDSGFEVGSMALVAALIAAQVALLLIPHQRFSRWIRAFNILLLISTYLNLVCIVLFQSPFSIAELLAPSEQYFNGYGGLLFLAATLVPISSWGLIRAPIHGSRKSALAFAAVALAFFVVSIGELGPNFSLQKIHDVAYADRIFVAAYELPTELGKKASEEPAGTPEKAEPEAANVVAEQAPVILLILAASSPEFSLDAPIIPLSRVEADMSAKSAAEALLELAETAEYESQWITSRSPELDHILLASLHSALVAADTARRKNHLIVLEFAGRQDHDRILQRLLARLEAGRNEVMTLYLAADHGPEQKIPSFLHLNGALQDERPDMRTQCEAAGKAPIKLSQLSEMITSAMGLESSTQSALAKCLRGSPKNATLGLF